MTIKEEIQQFTAMTEQMAELFARKRADYGQTTEETWKKFGPVSMLTRMYDKLGRLSNVMVTGEDHVGEIPEETLIDLANYALITILELRKERAQRFSREAVECPKEYKSIRE